MKSLTTTIAPLLNATVALALLLLLGTTTTLVAGISPLAEEPPRPLRFHEFPDGQKVNPSDLSPRFRLPTDVIPRYYKLKIRPILTNGSSERFTAPAEVTITLECLNRTNSIVLHADELVINGTSITVWPTILIFGIISPNILTIDDVFYVCSCRFDLCHLLTNLFWSVKSEPNPSTKH
jgi:hypothetical protein